MIKHIRTKTLAGVLVTAACALTAYGQANDALLNKLVDKGYLTAKEAEDLKKDTDNKKVVTSGLGMPDWVTGVKIYGDLRGRYDMVSFENDTPGLPNTDRQRYRVRARAGLVASFQDNLELGLGFTSGDTDNISQGGNPLSGNSTLQNNGSSKGIYLHLAYGKWTPIKNDQWTLSTTIGKMESPFTFSELVLDDDYTPEGGALQLAYKLNNIHSFKLGGGAFVIDEVNQGNSASSDPFLVGAQVRWDAKWNKRWESTVGLAAMSLSNEEHLGNGDVPNINLGNTRTGAAGLLVNNYNPFIADAAVTYWFEQAPLYKGRFPIRGFGTYMHNPSTADKNNGWEAGLAFGKAGKKGTWELSYRYRYLEADATYEELPHDDFGAFYAASLPGSGKGAGYGAGTNVKGHLLKASYSPYDALTLSISYFRTELIDALPKDSETGAGRLIVDAMWKF